MTSDPTLAIMNPWVQITKVEGGKLKRVSDWYMYPAVREIMPEVKYP